MRFVKDFIHFVPDEKSLYSLAGLYQSAFRGHGLEYEELRSYTPGDDIKHISWAKYAQTRELYSKTFREERELIVYLVVDISPSICWDRPYKRQCILETSALIACSAAVNRDRIGLIIGTEYGVDIMPAVRDARLRASRALVEKIAQNLSKNTAKLSTKNASFNQCLSMLLPVLKQSGGMVFVISDFFSADENTFVLMRRMQQKADVIALRILDIWDMAPCTLGEVTVQGMGPTSAVFGPIIELFCESQALQLGQILQQERNKISQACKECHIPLLDIIEPAVGIQNIPDCSYEYVAYASLKNLFTMRAAAKYARGKQ